MMSWEREISHADVELRLMTGCFLLPMSYLVENTRCVSRRSILFGTLAVFCVLVGVGACATDGLFLDMVSALAGLACACHIPTAISILSSAYPVPCRRKNMAFAFFLAGANPGGVILGGLGGGLVESRFTWRGSYVYVAAVFGLVAVVAWLAVPTFPRTGEPAAAAAAAVTADTGNLSWSTDAEKHEPPRQQRFNWVAVLFLACGVGTVTASLTLAPETPDGWATPYIFLLLVVGILCLACFVLWEGINPAPLVPSVLWRNRTLMLVRR